MAHRSAHVMYGAGARTLEYDHIADAVARWPAVDFLDDIVPVRVPGAVALSCMPRHNGTAPDKSEKLAGR
jgi:hypothetical protein